MAFEFSQCIRQNTNNVNGFCWHFLIFIPQPRDSQAIAAVKAAIAKPKTRDFPLIECEFPPLVALNKLGDGSMRSANEVDQVSTGLVSG